MARVGGVAGVAGVGNLSLDPSSLPRPASPPTPAMRARPADARTNDDADSSTAEYPTLNSTITSSNDGSRSNSSSSNLGALREALVELVSAALARASVSSLLCFDRPPLQTRRDPRVSCRL